MPDRAMDLAGIDPRLPPLPPSKAARGPERHRPPRQPWSSPRDVCSPRYSSRLLTDATERINDRFAIEKWWQLGGRPRPSRTVHQGRDRSSVIATATGVPYGAPARDASAQRSTCCPPPPNAVPLKGRIWVSRLALMMARAPGNERMRSPDRRYPARRVAGERVRLAARTGRVDIWAYPHRVGGAPQRGKERLDAELSSCLTSWCPLMVLNR